MKILAVDDDPIFLNILTAALQNLGHLDVTTAISARDAFSILSKNLDTYDCLLLDIQMPEIDGVQLCQAVRTLEAYRQTPIVMVTAMSDKSFVDGAFAAGATDYITKPLDQVELKARLRVVARLIEDRQRMAVLQIQASASASASDHKIDFSAPILIPWIDRTVEYLAQENYLITLGVKRLFTVAAFAIRIENAKLIHSVTNATTYLDMLGDVAASILNGMKTDEIMMSYVGNGDFVVLVQRNCAIDLDELALKIDISLNDFKPIYASEGVPAPEIVVGELIRGSIFASNRPTRIIDLALENVHTVSGSKYQKRMSAA
jgi:CheY-like chemotaxis protein